MQDRRCLDRYNYMPLEHFLAVASHCMPAFLQAASVFGVPAAANAGAVKATTRLKARIDANVFMMGFLRLQRIGIKTPQSGSRGVVVCYPTPRLECSIAAPIVGPTAQGKVGNW